MIKPRRIKGAGHPPAAAIMKNASVTEPNVAMQGAKIVTVHDDVRRLPNTVLLATALQKAEKLSPHKVTRFGILATLSNSNKVPREDKSVLEKIVDGHSGPFMAWSHKGGHIEFPVYYHPWDKQLPTKELLSLPASIELAKEALFGLQPGHEKHRETAILILGATARRITEELQHLVAEGSADSKLAAEQLWKTAYCGAARLEQVPDEMIKGFARQQDKMPALVGRLTEDRKAVESRLSKWEVAEAATLLIRRGSAKTQGQSPALDGTPINKLAASLIEFIETIRTLVIIKGQQFVQSWEGQHGMDMFGVIQSLPPLNYDPSIIDQWVTPAMKIVRWRYSSLLKIDEVNKLGNCRIDCGRSTRTAENQIIDELKKACRRLSKDRRKEQEG